jgi:tetratricopeptide (TPR) repeat protein
MERREFLLKCLGGGALALAPLKPLPSNGTGMGRTREFYELWEEACLSHYWFEDKRAYDLCLRALALAPENLESSKRADITEKLGCLRESLEAAEEDLARQREALKAEPQNPEKHFRLGFTLTRLGREEEAVAEYRLALENPEGFAPTATWTPGTTSAGITTGKECTSRPCSGSREFVSSMTPVNSCNTTTEPVPSKTSSWLIQLC